VALPEGATLTTFADGRMLDPGAWRVSMPPSEPRPTLELQLSTAGNAASGWVITLYPAASSADLQSPGEAVRPALTSVDLDRAGVGDRPW
jgi:hypothetical protein